jgi:hypothetical protein
MQARGCPMARCIGTVTLLLSGMLVTTPEAREMATLRGQIQSGDGESLPGAVVTLTCDASGNIQPRKALTDIQGKFKFLLIPTGTDCSLQAEVIDFASVVAGPVRLRPGEVRRETIILMSSASATERVTVTARGAVVDTENSTTSTTLNEYFIDSLPVVGRSFQSLLTLAPGVTDVDGDGNPNVRGARDTGMQYRIDGTDTTDPLTGKFGQHLNLDAVEEVEIITAGASVKYSRADGGFAKVTTKSGGNDFEGSLRLFYRGNFLDNDGSRRNDYFPRTTTTGDTNFRDMKAALSLGGPIVKNKVWFFTSVESLNLADPAGAGIGNSWLLTEKGYQGLAKLTWQVNSEHKLVLEGLFDPRKRTGYGLGPGVLPESDYEYGSGGLTTNLKWAAVISPRIFSELLISHFEKSDSHQPVSSNFEQVDVVTGLGQTGNRKIPHAFYPCAVRNCDRSNDVTNIYQIDRISGLTSGPYPVQDSDSRARTAVASDFSMEIDDVWGTHSIKTGFEFKRETYDRLAVLNPILFGNLKPETGADIGTRSISPAGVTGSQTLAAYEESNASYLATGGGMDFYLEESWKP